MRIILAILAMSLITLPLKAKIDCTQHPIYCQIVKNKSNIDKSYALKLSNCIYKATRTYKIPSNIFTAILMQESRYTLNSTNKHKGMRKLSKSERMNKIIECEKTSNLKTVDQCIENIPTYKKDYIHTDFGISQIHYKNLKSYNFDVDLLLNDLQYSVDAGAKVLRYFKKRYSNKESNWWSRYNSSNKEKRRIYEGLVYTYL